MVILSTDLKWYYSGSAAKSGPGGPQGGMISSVQVPAQTISGGVTIDNSIFGDVTNQEAANGTARYFCMYLKNTHGSQTASNIRLWQSSETPGQDNIRIGYSGVAANGHDPLLTSTHNSVYQVPLSTSFSTLDHIRKRIGLYVASQTAPVYDKTITKLELWLKKIGTPTGTLNVRQRGRTDDQIDSDFGSIDVSTISSTDPTLYSFSDPANTGRVHVEDIFTIEYTAGTDVNEVAVYRAAGSPIAGMHEVHYKGGQWSNLADFDICGGMFVNGPGGDQTAPTGVSFENPLSFETAISLPTLTAGSFVPIWLQNNIPANTPNQQSNTSEYRVRFASPDT